MATEGPNSPSTVVDDATVGTTAWLNPGNAASSNNVYATISLGLGSTSHYLKATGFGFSVPSGATINGIVTEFERLQNSGLRTIADSAIRIVKGGVIGATNKSASAAWSTSESYVSFGGASDLWGETWADTDINASNFGVVIAVVTPTGSPGGLGNGSIDHIRITVHYTAGGVAVAQHRFFSVLTDI